MVRCASGATHVRVFLAPAVAFSCLAVGYTGYATCKLTVSVTLFVGSSSALPSMRAYRLTALPMLRCGMNVSVVSAVFPGSIVFPFAVANCVSPL